MAEAILFNIAHSLLTNLGSTALDEIASAWGFKSRLEKLKNTINTIKDVLLDAEERQVESHALRGWLDRLKNALYAADDLFDEFATMVSTREVMGDDKISGEVINFFSHSNRIAFAFNICRKIKKIREELDDIVKDSSEFAFVLPVREEGKLAGQLRNQSHSFIGVEEVIGREDDRAAIIDILMASGGATQELRLSVIPIVGIGGLGKTTLAQLLFNDEQVNELFELKLWVCVSEIFDIKEVIKKILMSATNNESQNLEIDQLQGQLRKAIGGKKYLLVLDDVWNEKHEEWLNLSAILKCGGEGSKILVTTRSRKVADIMGTVRAYDLKSLSEEKSWALFENMAFEDEESRKNPDLVKLGKYIVKKCAAVPLALRTLGTLLRGQDKRKWISIAGTSFADTQNNVMAILKLSYHHLSSPLKNCFAYCALFPKNFDFVKETLVDLWIAEGFVILANETQSSKDVGDEYLMLLLQRCFFQDITRDKWGNISSFKMHDLMHDLALIVAGSESKVAKLQDGSFSDRIRHLSFDYHLTESWEIPSCMLKAKHLRTFLLTGHFRDGSDLNRKVLQQLIANFNCLRVLDLSNLGVRTLPNSIGKLIHLRHLNLSMNPLKELPHSITRLHNLQTLILYRCRSLKALPIYTRKLTNLMVLNVLGCCFLTHMPPGLGELRSLHKLPCFIVNGNLPQKIMHNCATAKLRDLKALNNLRGALKINIFEDLEDPASEAKEANLYSKDGLTELRIQMGGNIGVDVSGSDHDEAILEGLKPHHNLKKIVINWYCGEKLPSWAMADSLSITLPNLVEIRLLRCQRCQNLPSFSQLPFLRYLTLVRLERVEYMEISLNGIQSSPPPYTAATFFPSLQELELVGMGNLKGWWKVIEATDCTDKNILHQSCQIDPLSQSFSALAKLQIEDCPNLASFPLSITVEELVLRNVNKDLTVLKKLSSSTVIGDVGSSLPISERSSRLKILSVDEVKDLSYLQEEFLSHIISLSIQDSKFVNSSSLKEVFKHLSSLSCLEFTNCCSLTSISEGLEYLTSLESLTISNCRELDLSQNEQLKDGMPWKALKSLHAIDFHMIPKLQHLPTGLQHLVELHTLKLSFCPNLEALPSWLSCFSSLTHMELHFCLKLTCLPEEFCKLTTLYELEIVDCPRLTEKCRRATGSDWPKIQHIPLLIVKESDLD